MGFMVHARHFLTCAHVVNAALGRSDITARSAPEPGDRVHIEFSELSTRDQGKALPCKVVAWDPPSGSSADFTGDIAGLELSDVEDLPGESAAAPLIHYTSLPSPADGRYAIEAFGYPRSRPRGTFATGYFRRVFGPGLMQFETSSDMRPQVGFSGTPIIFRDSRTESTDYVVGMLSYSSRSSRDSYCVSTARLIRLWPQLRPSLVRSTLVCANMSRVRGFEVGPTFSTDGLRTIRDRYSLPDGEEVIGLWMPHWITSTFIPLRESLLFTSTGIRIHPDTWRRMPESRQFYIPYENIEKYSFRAGTVFKVRGQSSHDAPVLTVAGEDRIINMMYSDKVISVLNEIQEIFTTPLY
jgi:hypothetical protein